jgi:SnoaL-like domain
VVHGPAGVARACGRGDRRGPKEGVRQRQADGERDAWRDENAGCGVRGSKTVERQTSIGPSDLRSGMDRVALAVANLVYAYAERIDAGDFAGLADLFADAELTFEGMPGVRRGRDEILALYEATTRRYDDGTPKSKHVTTNLIIEPSLDSARAEARSYFTVLQAVPGDLALQPIVAGRYRDAFACDSGEWCFASRHITIDLVGELGAHLLFELPPTG